MEGRYLCGCDPKDPRLQRYTTYTDPQTGNLTWKRYDRQGIEVCPIHGRRLYGHVSVTKHGPQGNDITDYHKMYLQVYGTGNKERELGSLDIPDRRDNRDPNRIGLAYLSRKSKKTEVARANGHVLSRKDD